MRRNLKYFQQFFDDPASYNNREFHEFIEEWVAYMKEHEGEFDYLKDDEWKEARERIIDEMNYREDVREDFNEINEEFKTYKVKTQAEKIELQEKWLEFMKLNQFNYEFKDEDIAKSEAKLKDYIKLNREIEILAETIRIEKNEARKILVGLDGNLIRHYEKKGKIPILSTLHFKKRFKGN